MINIFWQRGWLRPGYLFSLKYAQKEISKLVVESPSSSQFVQEDRRRLCSRDIPTLFCYYCKYSVNLVKLHRYFFDIRFSKLFNELNCIFSLLLCFRASVNATCIGEKYAWRKYKCTCALITDCCAQRASFILTSWEDWRQWQREKIEPWNHSQSDYIEASQSFVTKKGSSY